VVLTGGGQVFSAGVDTRAFARYSRDQRQAMVRAITRMVAQLLAIPVPVVAAVNGHALGGGFVLMLACDYRIAVDVEAAKFGMTEAQAGIPFPAGPLEIIRQSPTTGEQQERSPNQCDELCRRGLDRRPTSVLSFFPCCGTGDHQFVRYLPSFAREDSGAAPMVTPDYRSDVDGLRAVAILSVVIYHALRDVAPGGFVGVDIFFVISGFLITGIILRGLSAATFTFVDFYRRRIRRILPALVIVLAATWVIGWFVFGSAEYLMLGRQISAAALFVSNFVLMGDSGYFAPSAELNPLLHLWSLAIEEQFYLLWPIALVASGKARLSPVTVIAVIGVTSFAVSVSSLGGGNATAFFSPITRSWELALGALLAATDVGGRGSIDAFLGATIRHEWPRPFAVNVRGLLAGLGFAAIIASIVLIHESRRYPSWITLFPTGGAALLLATGGQAWVNRRILSHPLMVAVGLISYPLYLWHWPLISLARVVIQHEPTRLIKIAIVAVAFILAWATTTYVERPIRTGRLSRLGKRTLVPLSLLVGLAAVAGLGWATQMAQGFPTRIPESVRYLDAFRYDDWPLESRAGSCLLLNEQDERDFAAECLDPHTTGSERPLVVLWGDSHAGHLYPGLKQIQPTAGFSLAQLTAGSCPPILDVNFSFQPACRGINSFIIRRIDELKPRIVVLAARWGIYPEQDVTKLEGTLTALKRARVDRIVLIGPVPIWNPSLPKALLNYHRAKKPKRLPTRMTFSVTKMVNLDDRLRQVANKFGVAFVSAIDAFCDADGCIVSLGNDPRNLTTWDSAHLTAAGSAHLAHSIAQQFGLDQTADRSSNVGFD
jgi:peptidoglycan/LPS O-acetylase OafA/YrhL